MRITSISIQARDKDRVNISVDGKYRFSLFASQLVDLGVTKDREYTDTEIEQLEKESQFGKIYSRALEYCLIRARSSRELRDYLYKKTLNKITKNGKKIDGVTKDITDRVFARLLDNGYVDDVKFAKYWVENRSINKGSSTRKLSYELRVKGISSQVISQVISEFGRDDKAELTKLINRKRSKYSDDKKFAMYLVRQGFNYYDVKSALNIQAED